MQILKQTPSEMRHNLRIIVADGALWSVMVGFGESYFPAFVVAVGLGEVAAGLVSAIPMLAGAVLQLVAPSGVRWMGSLRRWVLFSVALQCLAFTPLVVAALLGRASVLMVFLVAAIYWGGGLSAGGAWYTWVEWLIPLSVRTPYLARRSRFCQGCALLSLIVAGLLLQTADHAGRKVAAFALLFLIAGCARTISLWLLSTQTDPPVDLDRHRQVSWGELIARARHGADGRLLLYLMAMQISAQLAHPFLNPFLLQQVRLGYAHYMTLLAAPYLAKMVFASSMSAIAVRFGNRWLLAVGGLSLVPLSGLWMISDSYPYLLLVQVFVGFAFGSHELASIFLYFETIPQAERTSVLTSYNLLNAAAIVIGASVGGLLLHRFPPDAARQGYNLIFVLSVAARALSLILLARVLSAARTPQPPPLADSNPARV